MIPMSCESSSLVLRFCMCASEFVDCVRRGSTFASTSASAPAEIDDAISPSGERECERSPASTIVCASPLLRRGVFCSKGSPPPSAKRDVAQSDCDVDPVDADMPAQLPPPFSRSVRWRVDRAALPVPPSSTATSADRQPGLDAQPCLQRMIEAATTSATAAVLSARDRSIRRRVRCNNSRWRERP